MLQRRIRDSAFDCSDVGESGGGDPGRGVTGAVGRWRHASESAGLLFWSGRVTRLATPCPAAERGGSAGVVGRTQSPERWPEPICQAGTPYCQPFLTRWVEPVRAAEQPIEPGSLGFWLRREAIESLLLYQLS